MELLELSPAEVSTKKSENEDYLNLPSEFLPDPLPGEEIHTYVGGVCSNYKEITFVDVFTLSFNRNGVRHPDHSLKNANPQDFPAKPCSWRLSESQAEAIFQRAKKIPFVLPRRQSPTSTKILEEKVLDRSKIIFLVKAEEYFNGKYPRPAEPEEEEYHLQEKSMDKLIASGGKIEAIEKEEDEDSKEALRKRIEGKNKGKKDN